MQRQKDTFQLGSSNTDENDARLGSVSPWSEWPEFSQPKAFGGGPGEEFSGQSLSPRGGCNTITTLVPITVRAGWELGKTEPAVSP